MKSTKSSKTVVTKRPGNSSSANPKSGKSYVQQPQPVNTKPKKPRAQIIGSKSTSSQSATKKLNPSKRQSMLRPGLVTSKATGG